MSKDYSNLVVLDAPVLLLIDSFLKRAILKFLPTTFLTRMKLVNKDFEADRLSAAGTIALVFGDDKSEKAMTAKADRADCEKALHVKLEKGMSIETSSIRFFMPSTITINAPQLRNLRTHKVVKQKRSNSFFSCLVMLNFGTLLRPSSTR